MMKSFDDLVQNLRLSAKLMHWLTSSSSGKYKTFYLIKKDGSKRRIDAPARSLKIVQRWILDNILAKIKVSPYSFGFKSGEKGSPLVKCAEKHKNNLYILKVDLKNFYPSINKERVYYTFLDLGYNSSVANLLTDICVRDGYLPQGAVPATSATLCCGTLPTSRNRKPSGGQERQSGPVNRQWSPSIPCRMRSAPSSCCVPAGIWSPFRWRRAS